MPLLDHDALAQRSTIRSLEHRAFEVVAPTFAERGFVERDTTDRKVVAVDQLKADEAPAGSMRQCLRPLQMSLQWLRAGLPSMNASTSARWRNPVIFSRSRKWLAVHEEGVCIVQSLGFTHIGRDAVAVGGQTLVPSAQSRALILPSSAQVRGVHSGAVSAFAPTCRSRTTAEQFCLLTRNLRASDHRRSRGSTHRSPVSSSSEPNLR